VAFCFPDIFGSHLRGAKDRDENGPLGITRRGVSVFVQLGEAA